MGKGRATCRHYQCSPNYQEHRNGNAKPVYSRGDRKGRPGGVATWDGTQQVLLQRFHLSKNSGLSKLNAPLMKTITSLHKSTNRPLDARSLEVEVEIGFYHIAKPLLTITFPGWSVECRFIEHVPNDIFDKEDRDSWHCPFSGVNRISLSS